MTQWGHLIPIFLFAAFIGTLVTAPIYYLTANKLDHAGQIVVTLVVAFLLVALIFGSATDKTYTDTAALKNTMTVVILTPLAAGWIISALVSLLIWAFTTPLAESGSELPTLKEDELPSAKSDEDHPSSLARTSKAENLPREHAALDA